MAKKTKTRSVAEEFTITKEARWQSPTLEREYWASPNSQKGCVITGDKGKSVETGN